MAPPASPEKRLSSRDGTVSLKLSYQDELKTTCGNICESGRQRSGCRGNQNN